MKRIEQIQNISLEEIEKISMDGSIAVPEGLGARMEGTVRRMHRARVRRIAGGVGAFAVVAVAILGIILNREPALEDTFSDPYLAYAQIEKTFNKIGATVSDSADRLENSRKTFDGTIDSIFNE